MNEQETFPGVESEDVAAMIEGYEDDGASAVATVQDDGKFTVVVTYPDGWTPAGSVGVSPPPPDENTSTTGSSSQVQLPAISITLLEDEGKDCWASSTEGPGGKFYYGTRVSYRDDMARVGVYQDRKLALINDGGIYKPTDWTATHQQWAYFIWPTAEAESGGRFARLNSYDRAAFTFGFFQFAAHTPNENLIVLFRKLLAVPSATRFFPDLALRDNGSGLMTVHRSLPGGAFQNLEVAKTVTRPNGKREVQIPDFMAYLNSNATQVDLAERGAAARLVLWSKLDQGMRRAQVDNAVETVKKRMIRLKSKVPEVAANWRFALWGSDIMHQGRGSINSIRSAVASGNPLQALHDIGAGAYRSRVDLVRDRIRDLDGQGVMAGFNV
jgi:hypothetical protein